MIADANLYHRSVGRVYFKGDRKSSTAAAIISKSRALIFTNDPKDIESIELEKYSDLAVPDSTKKYKVVGIKGILNMDEGTLTCCEVNEDFDDIVPFQINRDMSESNFKKPLILGYGVHYDSTTRQPLLDESSDLLKCVDASPDFSTYFSKKLVCRFTDTSYKTLGWVGPDDLGALLIDGNDQEQPILLGLASKAGDRSIENGSIPFYEEKYSTFLRLSLHCEPYELNRITATPISPGYTEAPVEPPISFEFYPSSGVFVFLAYKNGATLPMKGTIDNGCVLIDSSVLLTIKHHAKTNVGQFIEINSNRYNVKQVSCIRPNVSLVYLEQPILNLDPIPFFYGTILDPSYEQKCLGGMTPTTRFHVIETMDGRQYLGGWENSHDFPNKMQEIQNRVHADIITDVLDIY